MKEGMNVHDMIDRLREDSGSARWESFCRSDNGPLRKFLDCASRSRRSGIVLAFSWISALRLLYCPGRNPLTRVSEKPGPPLLFRRTNIRTRSVDQFYRARLPSRRRSTQCVVRKEHRCDWAFYCLSRKGGYDRILQA